MTPPAGRRRTTPLLGIATAGPPQGPGVLFFWNRVGWESFAVGHGVGFPLPVSRLTPAFANGAALVLTLVGCAPMIGYVANSRPLRVLGAATAAAPFPKVFSDVDGFETFASEFTLHGVNANGERFALAITPELYSRLGGAYNRRNVYGAALSYAPRLPEPLWQAVFCFAFAKEGPLRRELGLPPGARDLKVEIRTKTKGRNDRWLLTPSCNE